jgi:hypothetical protein
MDISCPGSKVLTDTATESTHGVRTKANEIDAKSEAEHVVDASLLQQIDACSCLGGCTKHPGSITFTPPTIVKSHRLWYTAWIVVESEATAHGQVTVTCSVDA